jgi:hypothetical protein
MRNSEGDAAYRSASIGRNVVRDRPEFGLGKRDHIVERSPALLGCQMVLVGSVRPVENAADSQVTDHSRNARRALGRRLRGYGGRDVEPQIFGARVARLDSIGKDSEC